MRFKSVISLVFLVISLISCSEGEYKIVNVATPIYMSKSDFRKSVEILPPKSIIESGKIYAYNNLVLVNDVKKGIHIINNSNPENPIKIAFIKVIASTDMEIKGNYLYVNSLMDLVVFDISDVENIIEVARLEDVFPDYTDYPTMENLVFDFSNESLEGKIIVDWKITKEERLIEDTYYEMDFATTEALSLASTGQGGSLARFKIVDKFLYAVDSRNINIFNISNLDAPQELQDVYVGFDIETIFNSGDLLFLGSMRGMYIYNISSPATPVFISEFSHGTACDPVIVDDTYAYITLRAGNSCGAFTSSLEIVDITDVNNLKLVKSYPMDNPYGLGLKENILFICDGTSGLKVYDKTDVENLILKNTFEEITAFDVIPMTNKLLMIGENTLYQYHYTDSGLNLLSEFSLN
ncbi:LVIVD repeat-containing protein [Lutibacter sp.]